jgi:predicted alpha/beta-fold hydrolase
VLKSQTIWEFDDVATAPLGGFENAATYYAESSSFKFLGDIGVPTLLIHAEDDPFLPAQAIPRTEALDNPMIQLVIHPVGGHVGFLEGTPRKPSFWAEVEGARFLAEQLNGGTR